MKRMRLGIACALAVGFVFVGLNLGSAEAGRVITSKKRFRRKASSRGALIASWWRQHTRTFWEDKKRKRWKIYYAVLFGRRINDLEVTVELYDITKTKKFLDSFSLWLAKRGEKSVTSTLKLKRNDDGKFRANSKILLKVVDSRKRTLATTWFKIKGKVKKFSGKVSFTEAETRGLPAGSRGVAKKKEEPKLEPKGPPECPKSGVGRLMIWGCGSFL